MISRRVGSGAAAGLGRGGLGRGGLRRHKSTVLMMRHGESTWNLENRFTGWYDCPLSAKGHEEA